MQNAKMNLKIKFNETNERIFLNDLTYAEVVDLIEEYEELIDRIKFLED